MRAEKAMDEGSKQGVQSDSIVHVEFLKYKGRGWDGGTMIPGEQQMAVASSRWAL